MDIEIMASSLQKQDRETLLCALTDSAPFATVRGRQTLVRNALSGYPESADVDRALRFLDWEGEPVVVADQLLRLLDGQEPSPGISALGLLAQAVEPLAGAHREALNALRRRMRWGTDFASQGAETWKDDRPAEELVQERIIGENTLRPLFYLRRALRAADAVVRIDLDGVAQGTGFLVAPGLVMTNHHVIGNAEQAGRARAVFFDELAEPGRDAPHPPVIAWPAEAALVLSDEALDFSLLRFVGCPGAVACLPLRRRIPEENQRVAIIQHAGGEPKRISLQNNMVAYADAKRVQYYTSTMRGSSGSPVLDDHFAVVAIHHSWVRTQVEGSAKSTAQALYRNQGTSMQAVIAYLEARAPGLLETMTVVE